MKRSTNGINKGKKNVKVFSSNLAVTITNPETAIGIRSPTLKYEKIK